jgi:XRE family transcriptional regulator, fatty acid utilization regulator
VASGFLLQTGGLQGYIPPMNSAKMDLIGRRLQGRRESRGLSQAALSEAMGIASRQTLSKIENGQQAITPKQLVAAAKALDVRTDYFTDPFHAAGEATFSFRAEAMSEACRGELEDSAGRWLATYRELSAWRGEDSGFGAWKLNLTVKSRYEHAEAAAASIRQLLQLGDVPARDLERKLGSELGIQVLYVDLPDEVSGVASRMTGVQAILVNRKEVAGRRMFNLAHEVFHILTWDTIPPPELDSGEGRGRQRVEQLANKFASALLMPEDAVRAKWSENGKASSPEAMAVLADWFRVTGAAMKWRLINLGLAQAAKLPSDAEVAAACRSLDTPSPPPPLFNVRFVELVHSAVEAGRMSLRKALLILRMTSYEFSELCRAYGRVSPYEV